MQSSEVRGGSSAREDGNPAAVLAFTGVTRGMSPSEVGASVGLAATTGELPAGAGVAGAAAGAEGLARSGVSDRRRPSVDGRRAVASGSGGRGRARNEHPTDRVQWPRPAPPRTQPACQPPVDANGGWSISRQKHRGWGLMSTSARPATPRVKSFAVPRLSRSRFLWLSPCGCEPAPVRAARSGTRVRAAATQLKRLPSRRSGPDGC